MTWRRSTRVRRTSRGIRLNTTGNTAVNSKSLYAPATISWPRFHTHLPPIARIEQRPPMDWMTPVYLIVALLFVLMSGFFVLAEFALVKVRATRIEELARQGNRRAIVAREMVLHLDSYLA